MNAPLPAHIRKALETVTLDDKYSLDYGRAFMSGVQALVKLPMLQRLRDQLVADDEIRALWDAYEISDPLVSTTCTIESPIGTFTYETLTLANPRDTSGIVVQVPEGASRTRLARALRVGGTDDRG